MSKDVKRVMRKVIKTAGKRLPFKSEKSTGEMLGFAVGGSSLCTGAMVEAYRIGAEEAQNTIVQRLVNLAAGDTEGGK